MKLGNVTDLYVSDEAKVEAAALWLDGRFPGWYKEIEQEEFNMSQSEHCLGGYLGVDWYSDLTIPYRAAFGEKWSAGVFASYTWLWREEISKRLDRLDG